MMVWKMIFLFNWVIFRFHVNLPGCIESTWRLLLPNLNLREAIISVQGNMRSAWEEVPSRGEGLEEFLPGKPKREVKLTLENNSRSPIFLDDFQIP